jgi:hypothetical protein
LGSAEESPPQTPADEHNREKEVVSVNESKVGGTE